MVASQKKGCGFDSNFLCQACRLAACQVPKNMPVKMTGSSDHVDDPQACPGSRQKIDIGWGGEILNTGLTL